MTDVEATVDLLVETVQPFLRICLGLRLDCILERLFTDIEVGACAYTLSPPSNCVAGAGDPKEVAKQLKNAASMRMRFVMLRQASSR